MQNTDTMNGTDYYLVMDIGTGNVRVAIVTSKGEVVDIQRDNMQYRKDELYPDALFFDPNILWSQLEGLTRSILASNKECPIEAITCSSQREGIVVIDKDGKGLIGLPNHDHRGREWEEEIDNKDDIYLKTGRYPGSLFSAMKLLAIRKRQPELYKQISCVMSISDWAEFMLTGKQGYEHSQASETLLYGIESKQWLTELCEAFSVNSGILPPLKESGQVFGSLLPALATAWNLSSVPVITGGADTQLAVESTQPQPGDIVIVSGTTTPVVKITGEYKTDVEKRTWTNRHTDSSYFILETNAGVTGLNLQRLKAIFYPNEEYSVMEKELASANTSSCFASLGSLIAGEESLHRGGFVFDVPVSHELTRGSFVHAILWDMLSCIKANLDILISIAGCDRNYIWACGGGLQSDLFRQNLADLTGMSVRVRQDYQHASVVGGAVACNKALGVKSMEPENYSLISPGAIGNHEKLMKEWENTRKSFSQQLKEALLV